MKKFILVVDDDQETCAVMQQVLSKPNVEVCATTSPEVAIYLAETHGKIDLLISDLCMPRMDGLSLIKTLRAKGMNFPIIVVSGHHSDSFEMDLFMAECDKLLDNAFIPTQIMKKPMVVSELENMVSIILKQGENDEIK